MDPHRVANRDSILILSRAADRLLELTAGDVVRGRVVDVLPGGAVSLRIMGNLFQARSAVPLPPNANVLFRVVSQQSGQGGAEIRLQFLETIPDGEERPHMFQAPPSRFLKILAQELASHSPATETPQTMKGVLASLLKELPGESALLPRALRDQLLITLRDGLRNTDHSVQNRLTSLLRGSLSQGFPELGPLTGIKDRLLADVQEVLHVPLKELLENTGVALEAKLKALALMIAAEGDPPSPDSLTAPTHKAPQLETDLKGKLLQLRQALLSRKGELPGEETIPPGVDRKAGAEVGHGPGRLLRTVDGLLQDIHTFQLLSRLTDSFYTFLPFFWEGLKEGEIAFKRGRTETQGKSYYCLLHLDFERLGRLTIVTMLHGRDFFVSFKTAEERLKEHLSSNVKELEQMFQSRGLNLKGISFLGEGESRLGPFERLESLENIINFKI